MIEYKPKGIMCLHRVQNRIIKGQMDKKNLWQDQKSHNDMF